MHILWENYVKDPAAILTASSEEVDFPVENLAHNWYKRATRTTDVGALAAGEWWKVDLGSDRPVRYFALWYHNFEFLSGLDIRLQADNDPPNWALPAIDIPLTWTTFKLIHRFTSDQNYQWWRIYIENPGNLDGYLRGGVWYLGGHFAPRYNFRTRRIDPVDPSEVVWSENRCPSANSLDIYKEIELDIDAVPYTDKATWLAIFAAIGRRTPYILIVDSDDIYDESYYVINAGNWSFPPIVKNYYSFTLEAEETG